MKINFEKSFEVPQQEEWNKYLSDIAMNSIIVDENIFQSYADRFVMYPILSEKIQTLNNKVGNMKVSYALCRHYYDKGIPDEPYFISPGSNGQSVQYFPRFEEEHWMRLYWFNYYAESVYTRIFSIWDSITEILDTFYGMNIDKNMTFKFRVMEKIKKINLDIYNFLKNDIIDSDLYQTADRYRNSFVHYTAPSFVSESWKVERNKIVNLPEVQPDGTVKTLRKKATVFSYTVGDYTNVDTIIKNIQAFSKFTGEKIDMLFKMMIKEPKIKE